MMETEFFSSFVELKTNRLRLRQLRMEDAAMIFALQSDHENRQFLDRPKMIAIQEAQDFIQKINTGIVNKEWLYWGICQEGEDEIVGTICLWQFSKSPFKADVGYELHPEFKKRGIMNEALAKLTDYGLNELKLTLIEAHTHKDNVNSIRLLEKNNFTFVKALTGADSNMVVYAIRPLRP